MTTPDQPRAFKLRSARLNHDWLFQHLKWFRSLACVFHPFDQGPGHSHRIDIACQEEEPELTGTLCCGRAPGTVDRLQSLEEFQ